MTRLIDCPIISRAPNPKRRSAALFQDVTIPCNVLLTMAASEEATMAARSRRACAGSSRAGQFAGMSTGCGVASSIGSAMGFSSSLNQPEQYSCRIRRTDLCCRAKQASGPPPGKLIAAFGVGGWTVQDQCFQKGAPGGANLVLFTMIN